MECLRRAAVTIFAYFLSILYTAAGDASGTGGGIVSGSTEGNASMELERQTRMESISQKGQNKMADDDGK